MADQVYQSALTSAVQMSLSALTELEGMSMVGKQSAPQLQSVA